MEERKTFTFNGVNSADYGLYISGDSVYNAPSRVYEMVDIAGRNGQLAIDQGRFENIEVTYPAFIYAETQTEFAQRLREIRAWLMSPVGYQRLEDTYHPDEFRMAIYMSGLEADPTHYNEAGEFELTFNCKPQRFLKSGEEEIVLGEWGETETITGDIATFEGTDTTAIKSLVAQIEPKQGGSGDPSPTNVRPVSGWDGVNVTECGVNLWDEQWESNKTLNGRGAIISATGYGCSKNLIRVEPNSTVYFKTPNTRFEVVGYDSNKTYKDRIDNNVNNKVVTIPNDVYYIAFGSYTSGAYVDYQNDISINYPSTDTSYHPYQGETITKSLGQTVYGGTLDLVSGVLKSYPYYSSYSGQTLRGEWICDRAVYSQGTTPPTGSQVVDMGGTPTTYQLTAEQISTILGVNNIWADSGEVTVEYGDDPSILVNPTPFEALPLIEVVGVGSLTVGNTTVTITGDSTQDIFIDSDIMEAYEDDNGAIISRNDRINLSGTDFPKLGEETRVEANGLTSVKITPKWWTI